MARRRGALQHCLLTLAARILAGSARAWHPGRMQEVTTMCLRCGVVEYPYRSWPSGPTGPGDYGSPPDNSPPEYDAAPTGGFFGIGAWGRDYRLATGWWDRG